MTYRAPSGLRVGHIHLKVSDLDRSVAFYRDVLGFDLKVRLGDQAAFLSVDDYHHHIGLNTWHSKGGAPASGGHPGLYHVAFVYPERADLASALKNVVEAGVTVSGASDHGVSEAVYFNDPDGNGIEIYWDRPVEDWPTDEQGEITMFSKRLNLPELLSLAA